MKDSSKTNQELIAEISVLKKRIQELEQSEAERKRVEEALRKSEAKYRLIAENTADLISILDMNLHFTYVSPASMRLRGFTVEEAMEQTLEQVLTPESMRLGLTTFEEEMQLESSGTADPDRMRILELEEYKKDGSIIWVEVSLSFLHDKDRKPVEILIVSRDITERKQAEEALRERDIQFMKLSSWVPGMIYQFTKRPDGTYCVPFTTEAIKDIFGCSPQDVREDFSPIARILLPEDLDKVFGSIEYSAKHLTIWTCEYRVQIPGQSIRWMLGKSTPEKLADGSITWYGFNTDITERKRAEEELRESEKKYRNILENIEDGYFEVDLAGNFTFFNPSLCRILGYPREEMPGMNNRVFMDAENAKKVFRAFNEIYVTGIPTKDFEWETIRKDGARTYIEVSVSLIARPGEKPTGFRGIARDVTVHRRAEEEKRRSQETTERLAEEMLIIAEIGRVVGSTLDINQVFERVTTETHKLIPFDRFLVNLKKTPDGQFISAYVSGIDNPMRRVGDLYPSQGSATGVVMNTRTGILIQPTEAGEIKDLYPNLYETFKTGLHSTMSVPLISMDEVIGSMNFRSKKLKAYTEQDLRLAERIGMQIAGAIANAQLFDDLSKTEKSLRESELKYRSLIECSSDAIFCVDEKGQYTFTNHVFASTLGKSPDYFIGKTFWDVYPKEHADYRYETTKRVFQTGESESSEVEVPLPSKTLYFYATSNPIKDETGKVILILTHTTDITDRKKAEKKLQDTLESLRKAVGATIQVMVSAVETRDPYTSGHQIRSADLARAIAMEMGLPQDKIDAIRMAGSIHDIGKLSVPAEILSKPTKLSELEFFLIKEHAQRGYEMLKNVESPWPLAEIVYQHHERIDGSGYPRNLKGEEICMEARILTVADVVEAMASHRPYRPGLGIDAALNEIEKNRGIFYDNTVADACLRLFREKGYQIEGT